MPSNAPNGSLPLATHCRTRSILGQYADEPLAAWKYLPIGNFHDCPVAPGVLK
jgi:hypothetical protein